MLSMPKFVAPLAGAMLLVAVLGGCKSSNSHKTASEPMEASGEMMIAQPGPEHAWLAERAGTWKAMTRYREAPDQPWMTMPAMEENKVGLDGMWVFSTFRANFMGMPFEGRSQTGYDQYRGKYVSTWVDSMSSALAVSEGTRDPETGILTMTGKSYDPQKGQEIESRTEIHVGEGGACTMKMFIPDADGHMFEMMEITYTRMY